jgi:hypothetical protein
MWIWKFFKYNKAREIVINFLCGKFPTPPHPPLLLPEFQYEVDIKLSPETTELKLINQN